MAIFINEIIIKNYKCFKNKLISLKTPNGNRGSGLNILIGENGTGKTSILEAINYLTLNSFSAENKLKINDFHDFKEEIVIEAKTQRFSCKSSIDFYRDWYFRSNGIGFKAKSRRIKKRGSLLSSPFQINNYFLSENRYIKKDGSQDVEVDGRDKIFSNSRINGNELNIFFFDKNRTRQIATGNYKTTFEKICDDLNWNFIKNLDERKIKKITKNIAGEYFKSIQEITNKGAGQKTAKDLANFFESDEYKSIQIELINLLHPFSNAFFALRDKKSLCQVSTKNLGSGIEIILTLLVLKNIAGASNGSIIYLIDEPELHLHPRAQSKLFNLLLEESKEKQIIISTHSPYLFREAITANTNLLVFKKNDKNNITINNARNQGWGLLPWSPSWGEINFFAYDMATVEFHDELYGHLHEIFIGNAIDQADANLRSSQNYFEKQYLQKKITPSKKWTREFGGVAQNEECVTLATYIRNKWHHPENKVMQTFGFPTDNELKQSIKELISIIKNP